MERALGKKLDTNLRVWRKVSNRRWKGIARAEDENRTESEETEERVEWKPKAFSWNQVDWKRKNAMDRVQDFKSTPLYRIVEFSCRKMFWASGWIVEVLSKPLVDRRWKWMVDHLVAMASAFLVCAVFAATAPYHTPEFLAYRWPKTFGTEHIRWKAMNVRLTPKFSKHGKLPKRPGVLEELVRRGRIMNETKTEILDKRYEGLEGSFCFLEVSTGAYVEHNMDAMYSSSSIIKLPVLVAFLQAVDAGEVSLFEKLFVQDELIGSGGGMQYKTPGTQLEAWDVIDQMIAADDNTATNTIVERLGGMVAVNRVFKSWGLRDTYFRSYMPDLDGMNSTSVKDMVYLLALLEEGNLLSMRNRDLALKMLKETTNNTMLPMGAGTGATVAHKAGDLGFIVGDVGIIDMPKRGRFIAAAFVRGPFKSSNNVTYVSNVCSKFCQEAYDHLKEHGAQEWKTRGSVETA